MRRVDVACLDPTGIEPSFGCFFFVLFLKKSIYETIREI